MQSNPQDQQIERAAKAVAGDSISEFILLMDRRQGNPALQRKCPTKDPKHREGHGALGVSGDGRWLICGKCEHREGISRGQFEGMNRDGYLPHELPQDDLVAVGA